MLTSILKDCRISYPVAAAVAAQTDVTGSGATVDMSADGGYDCVCFIALLGTVTDGCVLSLQGRESLTSNGASDNVITGSKTADFTAATSSNLALISDCLRPSKRFVFPLLKRGTQNAVVNGIIAIQYRGKKLPSVNPADILAAILGGPEN